MSWTYSGDPKSSELDEYRFLIRDTNVNRPLLQDEEIQYILDGNSSKTTRLYYLYNSIADLFGSGVRRSLGPESEDPTERIKYYQTKAAEYKKLMSQASGISLPATACKPPIFRVGMNDNVR